MATFDELTGLRLDIELNSNSTVRFTSTRRAQYINDAAEEFATLTECLVRYSSVTLSCNTVEYQLLSSGVLGGSTDFVRFAKQGVEFLRTDSNDAVTHLAGDDFPERPLQWRHRNDPGWRASTTPTITPSGYAMRPDGGNLYLRLNEPPDIGSSESASLIVPYVARPAPMTSSSAEPFTVNSSVRTDLRIYHKYLPHYAAYKLLPLIGDYQGAQAQLQMFLAGVNAYLANQRPKGGQHVQFAKNYLQAARSRGDADGRVVPGWTWRSGG